MGIVGSRSVTDTRRLRGFAGRNRLRQRWIDPDDRRAQAPLRGLGVAPQQTLVVLWRGQPGPELATQLTRTGTENRHGNSPSAGRRKG